MLKAGAIRSAGAFWRPGAPAITAASLLSDGETILEIGETVTRPLTKAELKRLGASGPEASETFETALAEALSQLPCEIAGIGGAELMGQGGAIPDFNGAALAFHPSPIPAPEAAPTKPRSTSSSPIRISYASPRNRPSPRPSLPTSTTSQLSPPKMPKPRPSPPLPSRSSPA